MRKSESLIKFIMAFLSDLQKIGVGLTGFGICFMILGIILFFDGGLLAIGNVCELGLVGSSLDSLLGWNNINYWHEKNNRIFLSKGKTSRNALLLPWSLVGFSQVAVFWRFYRVIWFH